MDKVFTVNGFISIFKSIAHRHKFINDFGFGPTANIGASRSMKLPYLWVEPTTSTVSYQNHSMIGVYNFDIYVMDKIDKGDSNFQDSISDTDFIVNTVLAEIFKSDYYNDNNIKIVGDILKQHVHEATDDNSNGWMASIAIQVPLRIDNCNNPMNVDCEEDCDC